MKARHPAWQNSALRRQLIAARNRQGYKLEAFAAALGYCRQTIAAWERGYRAPDAPALFDWAEALGMELRAVTSPAGPRRR